MKNKQIILVNTESNNSKKVINFLKKNNKDYYADNDLERSKEYIRKKLNQGYTEFIICGGDGTINKFINEYCKLPKIKREKIILGIVPCGRANDLARELKMPFDVNDAFQYLDRKRSRKIDIIKVNNSFFITGGGLGLPTEIIKEVNNYQKTYLTKLVKKILGESIYFWITLKKMIFGYNGIQGLNENLLAIYVLNQSFIGKRFKIAPESRNADGFFDIKHVKMPPSFFSKFKTLSRGSNGKIDELYWVNSEKLKKTKIKLKKICYFMGDGELLEKNNVSEIEILPKDIDIITN